MEASLLGWVAGEAVSLMFRGSPRLQFTRSAHHWHMITGEPGIDYNMAWVDATPDAETHLRAYNEALGGAAGFVQLAAAAAESLAPLAENLGFAAAGEAPLMVGPLDHITRPAGRDDCQLITVATEHDLEACHQLMVEAFQLDPEIVKRCMGPLMLDAPGLSLLLLQTPTGEPLSTVITVAAGSLVGIWSMATASQAQRQGYGRYLLASALADARPRATHAYLIASDAGEPLYRSLGLTTVEHYAMWIREDQSQHA